MKSKAAQNSDEINSITATLKNTKIATPEQKFGITITKETDFTAWYVQVLNLGNMFDYYEISGMYIMKPSSMFIWKKIQNFFTAEIEKLGVKEVYFPMLLTKHQIEKEQDHVENFAPELAWITKCGNTPIEPVAIRPTSECIIYPSFAKWIRTHRDLPVQVNQWCSVLRWEVKSTLPFIRGREFLWQEGHSVFLDAESCKKEVKDILLLYKRIYNELLALPVIEGFKSENEKFGGADYSLSIECFVPETGRAIQAATSHFLGTNFSKIFDIKLDDYLFQNSWGISTRSIGIAAMLHSDNRGLVLPPRVSILEVVVVPCGITKNTTEEEKNNLYNYIDGVRTKMNNFSIEVDMRDNVTPGYKFNYWELQGVPIRMEIGFKNMNATTVTVVRRCDAVKKELKVEEDFENKIKNELNDIHATMLKKQEKIIESKTLNVSNFEEMVKAMNDHKMAKAFWCGSKICEEDIKKRTTVVEDSVVVLSGAKSICLVEREESICFNCCEESHFIGLFGRTY